MNKSVDGISSSKVRKSTDKVEELERKIDELTGDLQRAHADFVNFRRRNEEEQQQIMTVAKQAVVSRLLPLVDNLERALNHMPAELAGNNWAQGVSQVSKQIETTLDSLGVQKINAVGQPFDPAQHEATGLEDGAGEHEIVAEELRAGYKMDNQVIRPSMVKVKRVSSKE